MSKTCIKCGIELVIGKNCTQNGIDGSNYICRDCKREHHREYNKKNREHVKEYHREYRKKNREHRREYQQEYQQKNREYNREYQREYAHRTGRCQPMSENKSCASYLGIVVAERVLSKVFKNVEKMSYGNPGYDFICGKGYKVDVKSSCIHKSEKQADSWVFHIDKNKIADYFLCLAFDNRDDLNPLHIWLIPGNVVNHLTGATISVSTIIKWDEYKLDVDKVIRCCNTIKGDK